jgi:iron complex outermembrane receptor protein
MAMRATIFCGSLVALLCASSVHAQQQEPEPAIAEVTVTAQRRSEDVQRVPISVSVVGATALADHGIKTLTELIPFVPGFTGDAVGQGTPVWAIRGISTTAFDVGSEPSIGVFIDDAYIGRNVTANTSFFDVDHVEVLKGPQGTLFGRNAVAGAINIVSNKPRFNETSGRLTVGAGNYGQREGDFALNLSSNDDFAFRLSGSRYEFDGFQRNLSNGKRVNGDDDWALRAGARWRFSESAEALLTVQHNEYDSLSFRGPNVTTVADPFTNSYYNNVPDDPHETNKVDGVNLRITSSLADDIELTSITDFRRDKFTFGQSADATPDLSINFFQTDVGLRSISQELRLTGSSEQYDWLAGVSFWREHAFAHDTRLTADGFTLTALGFVPPGTLPDDLILFDQIGGDAVTHSYAAYGDVTRRLSSRWSVKAGIRLTRDEKDWYSTTGEMDLQLLGPAIPGGRADAKDSWTNVSPRLVLDFEPNDRTLLYGSVTRGYKGGGFNTPTDGVSAIGFDPEHITAYELGFKSTSANGALRLNGAAYYNDYTDLQILTIVNSVFAVSNAATARVQGLELEGTWRLPQPGLELVANFGLQDSEVKRGFVAGVGDVSGNSLVETPRKTFGLSARYEHNVGAGKVTASSTYTWRSKTYFDISNREDLAQDSYGQLGVRLAYGAADGRWEAALVGDNLTDKEFATWIQDPIGLGAVLIKGRPRMYRAQLSFQF